MKKILFIFCLLSFSLTAFGQTKTINKFYRQHKKGKEVKNFKIPGWLMHLGANIANKFVDEPQTEAALELVYYLKNIRLMFSEDAGHIPEDAINQLTNTLRKAQFEDWITISDGDSNVSILAREKKGIVRNLLFLVKDEEDLVFMSIKTKLPAKDFGHIIAKIINESMKKEKKALKKKKQKVKGPIA